jgi:hypothetical protein
MNERRSARAGGVAAVAALTLLGCAATRGHPPPPVAQFAAAEAAIAAARESGTAQATAPSRHLRAAENELALARQRAQARDGRGAGWALERAQADAELSQALSRLAREEAEAQRLEALVARTRVEMATELSPPAPAPPPDDTAPPPPAGEQAP